MSKAIFAAASTHKEGFIAAFDQNGIEEVFEIGTGNLAQQIKFRSNFEVYPLERGHSVGPGTPNVAGNEFYIYGNVEKTDKPLVGMLAVHGSKNDGYALYIKEDKLHFLVKQQGKKLLFQVNLMCRILLK